MVDWIKSVGPGLIQQIMIALVAALATCQVMVARLDERVMNMERTTTRLEQTANASHSVYDARLRACEITGADLTARIADLTARMNIVYERERR